MPQKTVVGTTPFAGADAQAPGAAPGGPRVGSKTVVGVSPVASVDMPDPGSAEAPITPATPTPVDPSAGRVGAKTVVGMVQSPPAVAGAGPADAFAKDKAIANKTVIGFAGASAPPAQAPEPPAAAAPQEPKRQPAGSTLLGISPLEGDTMRSGTPGDGSGHDQKGQGPNGAQDEGARAAKRRAQGGTMLGVAMPGIAPTRNAAQPAPAPAAPEPQRKLVQLPSAPERPRDEPLPEAPAKRDRRGVSLTVAAAIGGVLTLGGGIAIALSMRAADPLLLQPSVDEKGRDHLKLECSTCPDGTTATLRGQSVTFQGGAAEIALESPLTVGDNALSIDLVRPGWGRDETVDAVVPISYRVAPDLAPLAEDPPAIGVRVEARKGTRIEIGGSPVELDPKGQGRRAVAIGSEIEGPKADAFPISRDVPYVITTPTGKTHRGHVRVELSALPLVVDAPGPELLTERDQFHVAGRSKKGATVTVNGTPIPVDATGAFDHTVPIAAGQPVDLNIIARAEGRAPRIVRGRVERVASASRAAAERKSSYLTGYDSIGASAESAAGQRVFIEGPVVESRATSVSTIALVRDAKSCASGSCLVRVIYGEPVSLAPKSNVRVLGLVTGAVKRKDGTRVPELAASVILSLGGGR